MNAIKGDSFDLVDKYDIGFNLTECIVNFDEIVFMENDDYQKMRKKRCAGL